MSRLLQRPKSVASVAALTVASVAVATLAFAYEGNPTTKVDLNDGGVWLTRTSEQQLGHFNNESTILDGGLYASTQDFDVLQDESNILLANYGENAAAAVDPARVAMTESVTLPSAARLALNANTVAVLDPETGDLWVSPFATLSGLDITQTEPIITLGEGADVVVGTDGTVYGVNPSGGTVVTIPTTREGTPEKPSERDIGELKTERPVSITVVGKTAVVLSPSDGVVISADGLRAEVPGASDAVLQQPSEASPAVAVANSTQLLQIPFDGTETVSVSSAGAAGVPAEPVSLLGCFYAAWSQSAQFVRDCAADSDDVNEQVPDAGAATDLRFRVNRNVIILNDGVSGNAWLADQSLQQVDNWQDLTPPEGDEQNEEDESTEETVETTLPKRTPENTLPVAEDDEYGVRPGQTTILTITDNDNDPDGDVLVASVEGSQPSIGTVQPIYDGGALQIEVPEDASGSASFSYKVEDGRGGEDTATVRVTVNDWDDNAPPKAKRITSLAVEAGGTISYNILPDWFDPNGDDVYLRDVLAAPGDQVEFTTDGQITYHALGSLQGRKDVKVVIADALGDEASGVIALDVRPPGSTLPKTNADHVVTFVGTSVTVSPLTNDSSTGREPLILSRVDDTESPGATIVPDYPNKSFTFTAPTAGVYYVQYLVASGPSDVAGLVRIDVVEPSDSELPPVAVRDVVLLPSGGETLYGVLENDTDPAGGVLVLQSVSVPSDSGVSVSVLNHETLRIGDKGALNGQTRITYTISNGYASATADVIVIPIPPPQDSALPVAADDDVTVRVNDVVTIDVLKNDTAANGEALQVLPDLGEPLVDPADGEAFVSQNTVRFRAGSEAKTVYLTYQVADSIGQVSSATISVQIREMNPDENAAPRPQDVTARVVSGSATNIAIPLDGIDSDGDSVELVGLRSNPTKGRVEVSDTYITYTALDTSIGVDTFGYIVRDRLGKEGFGTVRIGIAPPEVTNQPPYAVEDNVVVRPGREISVPALVNDSDPEGELPSLVTEGLVVPDVEGLEARVSGNQVVITAPEQEMDTSVQYTITDSLGATAQSVIQVHVANDVPLESPIARDDRVRAEDLTDDQETADVDILVNDEDPDGTTQGLDVVVEEGGTLLDNNSVRVAITDTLQLIKYTITDQDGLTASGFIFVPALQEFKPSLISTQAVVVNSGETKELPLSEYVFVPGGGDVIITEAAKVSAIHSNGANLIKDASTLVYTPAAEYFGADAVTFEVTDGTGPDDAEGRKAVLTIPITVLPPDNQPPTFANSSLTVAPGEAPAQLDLQALTSDPDPDDTSHTFEIVDDGGSADVSVRLDGSTLVAESPSSAKKGTAVSAQVRVSDGTSEPVEGTVTITISASTRPLPVAAPDEEPEAVQGEPVAKSVLENDFNPFPETPLKIVSASVTSGSGAVTFTESEVTATPAKGFVGSLVVQYRIQDATGDVDREVNGNFTLTVRDVPAAPGKPNIERIADSLVAVSYAGSKPNGEPVEKYTVTSASGPSYTKECGVATACTLDGLRNNTEYTFIVTATNAVGESEPSPASAVARPDVRPEQPAPPTAEYQDSALVVTWTPAETKGSPIKTYDIEISPARTTGGASIPAMVTERTGTTYTWSNLDNGTAYQFRVRAHNSAPTPSDWSEYSTPQIPVGVPRTVAKPSTEELSPVGSQAQMEVAWQAPYNNGAAIDQYEVAVYRGGSLMSTTTTSDTKAAIVVDTSTTAYTFAVRAHNKAKENGGWGEWSVQSDPRRGVIKPNPPTGVTAAPEDRALTVTYQPGAANGASNSEVTYQYSLNGGGWQSNWDGSRITGLNNGTTYSVSVRAVSTVNGATYAGDGSAASNGVVPYGPIGTPTARAVRSGDGTDVTFSWSPPAPNGRAIQNMQMSINGGEWTTVELEGSRTRDYGYSESHNIKVRAFDEARQMSEVATASVRTVDPPPPTATIGKGPLTGPRSGCANGKCNYLVIDVDNFKAGTYNVTCWTESATKPPHQFSSGTGTSYSFPEKGRVQLGCFYGTNATLWARMDGANPGETNRYYFTYDY